MLPKVSKPTVSRETLASMLSLDATDLLDGDYAPQGVSCGLPFLLVPLRDRKAVARSRLKLEPWEHALKGSEHEMVMVFAADAERPGSDMHARMYGPSVNVIEDPATGSACACLAGYLAARTPGMARCAGSSRLRWGAPASSTSRQTKRTETSRPFESAETPSSFQRVSC
jgi:trans-2,3-dihydro-3-hydroxyanthranilate isomerase